LKEGEMIRSAWAAGKYYPDSPDELREMMSEMIHEEAVKQEVIGMVLPHAGYIYSGPVVGEVLSRVVLKDTAIVIGPSHTGNGKPQSIMTEGTWETPFGNVEIDSELAKKILESSEYLEEDERAHRMEHSIEVQLPFLQYLKPDIRLVPIVLGYDRNEGVYKEVGRAIAAAIKALGREAVIIASSDMTHYESQEVARQKDMEAAEAVLDLDEDELVKRVREFNITMCGYATAVSLITAAKELGARGAELVRYQTSGDVTGDYSAVVGYAGIIITGSAGREEEAHSPLVELAKQTVESYVKEGKIPEIPEELAPEMEKRAGVFVSIHKAGRLRGCIGTFEPAEENVAGEIISNAIASATRDPRFNPIKTGELDALEYSIDVLTTPEPVESEDDLDPKKYGVIVQSGYNRGLLLPDLEGVDTVEEQIAICRQKAGIPPDAPVKLYRFEVKRYK
jgi:AmmeMemoRadiSam system protein B/AmmeMemoRadiSam system protein A